MTYIPTLHQTIKVIGSLKDNYEFIEKFLFAFGLPTASVDRLKSKSQFNINEGVKVGQQIFFMSSSTTNLYSELNILKKNDISKIKTRFIILANADDILALDAETNEELFSTKEALHNHVGFFFPLMGRERPVVADGISANIEISEKFAEFYNECRIHNDALGLNYINDLVCRILISCFLNSNGELVKLGTMSSLIQEYTLDNGDGVYDFLNSVFNVMSGQSVNNSFSDNVCFIDNRLFQEKLPVINFSRTMRSLLIDVFSADWTDVTPEVLGAMLQSIVVDDEDGKYGGNYTAKENVQKIIGPLFLDDLYNAFESVKGNHNKCETLIERINNINVLDISCGAGSILLITYNELNKLLETIGKSINYNGNIIFPYKNIFGIEENTFSCIIARIGLMFAVSQKMSKGCKSIKTEIGVLFDNNIKCGNPALTPWEEVCPGDKETYIIGNPAYKGARKRNDKQISDMEVVFSDYINYKNLDYAANWFLLASKYINAHGGGFAFVTTNSLTQGEQVSLLWPKLFAENVHIKFAHKAFKWRNDARNTTAVTVVIIGVATDSDRSKCRIFTQTNMIECDEISPYLTTGSSIVEKRKRQISDLPPMIKGNMPYDGGYLLLDSEEKDDLVKQDDRVIRYIRKIVGSDEFIKRIDRWCIWITDEEAKQALQIPALRERVEKVKELRLGKTDKNAQRLAQYAYRFREMRETKTHSLVIPAVSSENREYIPVGFIDNKTVVSNLAFVIYDCDPWIFGVISSKMHNLWIRAVCGGLETRIRYSSELGYNTFPFPAITEENKKNIRSCVNQVIFAREEEFDKSYAQMYRKEGMSSELSYAHKMLDMQVELCYQKEPFLNDDERLECLFNLYERMTGEKNG